MKKKMKGRWKGKEKLLLGIWGGIVGIGGECVFAYPSETLIDFFSPCSEGSCRVVWLPCDRIQGYHAPSVLYAPSTPSLLLLYN